MSNLKPVVRKFALPAVAVAVIAVGVVVAMNSGLDKELLRQQVDQFAKSLQASAARHGRDVTFTYSDITVEGPFMRKYGVIHGAKLTNKSVQPATGVDDSLVVSTESIAIHPKAVDFSAIEVQMPDALEVTTTGEPEKKLLTITAAEPLTWQLAQTTEKGAIYLDVNHPVASKIDFTYLHEQQAQGTEDTTPTIVPVYKTFTITTAAGGSIQSHFSKDDKNLGRFAMHVNDVRMLPKDVPNGEIKIAEIAIDSTTSLTDKNRLLSELKVKFGDLTTASDFIPYAPMSLVIDGTYDRAAVNATPTPEGADAAAPTAESTADRASVKLETFALSTKDSKLTAQADFKSQTNEMLPVGTANLTLTNLPYVLKELRDNAVLDAKGEALATPLLEKISGQKLADITDLVIDINRPQGGAFTIGKSTFEELFALTLSGAMQQANPALPPADKAKPAAGDKKPSDKGAMILEDSARG